MGGGKGWFAVSNCDSARDRVCSRGQPAPRSICKRRDGELRPVREGRRTLPLPGWLWRSRLGFGACRRRRRGVSPRHVVVFWRHTPKAKTDDMSARLAAASPAAPAMLADGDAMSDVFRPVEGALAKGWCGGRGGRRPGHQRQGELGRPDGPFSKSRRGSSRPSTRASSGRQTRLSFLATTSCAG